MQLGSLHKDPFNEHRWRCIFSPKHAQGTLKPFATLGIRVNHCRDLIGNKSSTFTRAPSSDPYYEIYVDDILKYTSGVVHNTVNPNFKEGVVDVSIHHPMSIVRVQIMDEQSTINKVFLTDDILGFVEFPVADLSLGEAVHGLYELRFRTMLIGSAQDRVKHHKSRRDEHLSVYLPNEDVMPPDGTSLVPQGHQQEFEDIDPMSTIALRGKKRRKGLLETCDQAPGRNSQVTRSSNASGVVAWGARDENHLNGGVCLIELFLQTTHQNVFFAACLPKPTWTHFPPPIARRTDLPQVDLQHVFDTASYVKDKVFDRCLLCVLDFTVYLFTWQNSLLSLFNLALAILFALFPERVFSIFPFTIGVYMVLLSFPSFRMKTTINAHTAMLNDVGYRQVASLDDTKSASIFLRRVIKYMRGAILNEEKAEHFAALSVRDGKPALNFQGLEQELRLAATEEDTWIEFRANSLKEETPVLILPVENEAAEEELGKVVQANPDGTYVVFSELTRTNKLVREDRLSERVKAPYVPKWIIPTGVENQLRGLYQTMSKLRDQMIPALNSIRRIVCWENWWASLALTVTCFTISFTLTFLRFFGVAEEGVLRAIQYVVAFIIVFAIFVLPSWWCQRFLTIVNACTFRVRHLVRYRYKRWAFFHEISPGLYTNQEMQSLLHWW